MTKPIILWSSGPFQVTPDGLVITGKPTLEQWAGVGPAIARNRSAWTWALGDWIAYGGAIKAWGEKYDAILSDIPGLSYERASSLRSVSARFPRPARQQILAAVNPTFRAKLGWSFFQTLAPLQNDTQVTRLLKVAEGQRWTRDELRTHVRDLQFHVRQQLQKWPKGQYGLILADPPWPYEAGAVDPTRQIENQYPPMTVEAIKAAAVADLAAPNCVLYLWATSAMLVSGDALAVLAAWGFTGRSTMVWIKDLQGAGYWARQRHEHLLIGVHGSPIPPDEHLRPDSVIVAPRREHSQKPDELYAILERCYPARLPKIELFARARRPGWTAWGNQRLGPVAVPA